MTTPQKIEVSCPECGKQQEILWFPWTSQSYMVKGNTGSPSRKLDVKNERVEGECECGHKFKAKDLD